MFSLSKRSRDKLLGVHPDLIRVVQHAITITPVDFSVVEGLRSYWKPLEYFTTGKSKTMNSRHLTGHAADIVPLLDEKKDGNINAVDRYDQVAIRKLAPFIKKAAKSLGVPIEWGGDWQSFPDGPHWQLPRSYK